MRSDDIRKLTIEAADEALLEAAKVRERHPELEADVAAYETAVRANRDFWVNASPAFCHAWFQVISEKSG